MTFQSSPVFRWNFECRKPTVVNQGGSSSGKTFSILQVILTRLAEQPGKLAVVTGESFPSLRRGPMEDMVTIREMQPFKNWIEKYNDGISTYTLKNGSRLQFSIFFDQAAIKKGQGAKGGRRDFLFMNEADGLPWTVASGLIMRTRQQVFIDFNPTSEFWAHEKLPKSERVEWFYSTFLNNPFLDSKVREDLLALKESDPDGWRVYGLGRRGRLQGQVFPNVNWVDKFPEYAGQQLYGLDIGFANSFTALCRLGMADGQMYGEELLYQKGLIDEDLAERFEQLGISRRLVIVCDSANQMTIAHLNRKGFNVVAAKKTNVADEIAAMKRYKWNITHDSSNWRKEAKNYRYPPDGNGGFLNIPIKNNDHIWDASRYAFHHMIAGETLPQFF